jgi:hypothetical protein
MKIKKFNLNWPSVLLGMALCLVLVVVMGSKAAGNPQTPAQVMTGTSQRPANVIDVWNKTVAMEDRLIRIEKKIDHLVESMQVVVGKVRAIYKDEVKK